MDVLLNLRFFGGKLATFKFLNNFSSNFIVKFCQSFMALGNGKVFDFCDGSHYKMVLYQSRNPKKLLKYLKKFKFQFKYPQNYPKYFQMPFTLTKLNIQANSKQKTFPIK